MTRYDSLIVTSYLKYTASQNPISYLEDLETPQDAPEEAEAV